MEYCRAVLAKLPQNYKTFADDIGNLISLPDCIPNRPIVYLSAHIDTVPADATEWDPPFHPFVPFEDSEQLIGRGVNDCKAGVAFQLTIAEMIAKRIIVCHNVAFLITFKEEGPGVKTATKLGAALGKVLPINNEELTYLIVLENTTSALPNPILEVFLSERTNYAVQIRQPIRKIRSLLAGKLSDWQPIAIAPIDTAARNWAAHRHIGGHAAQLTDGSNPLREILLKSDEAILVRAGVISNFATVPATIETSPTAEDLVHICTLNLRSEKTPEAVANDLKGESYIAIKDFSISGGLREHPEARESPLLSHLQQATAANGMEFRLSVNRGSSDATIITSQTDISVRKHLIPLVAGPGCRSERLLTPQRLTHGKNETFFKAAGLSASNALLAALVASKFCERA